MIDKLNSKLSVYITEHNLNSEWGDGQLEGEGSNGSQRGGTHRALHLNFD